MTQGLPADGCLAVLSCLISPTLSLMLPTPCMVWLLGTMQLTCLHLGRLQVLARN